MGEAAEVFHVSEVDRPEPGPGEVLVRVHASGVNPTDYKARSGAVPRPIDDYQIPHQDGAGVIEAVGAGVDSGRVGERVWLWLAAVGRRCGTAAEWTTALLRLIDDCALRRRLWRAQRRRVATEHDLVHQARAWPRAWTEILTAFRASQRAA